MSKSRIAPSYNLYQILIQDYKHRQPPPPNMYVDKSGKGVREVVERVPLITKLRWAKNGSRAMQWAKKFGSVVACFKVHSHEHRLQMIEHLRVEPKPVEIDISPEEFIIGRDLKVESTRKIKKVDVNGGGDIDK